MHSGTVKLVSELLCARACIVSLCSRKNAPWAGGRRVSQCAARSKGISSPLRPNIAGGARRQLRTKQHGLPEVGSVFWWCEDEKQRQEIQGRYIELFRPRRSALRVPYCDPVSSAGRATLSLRRPVRRGSQEDSALWWGCCRPGHIAEDDAHAAGPAQCGKGCCSCRLNQLIFVQYEMAGPGLFFCPFSCLIPLLLFFLLDVFFLFFFLCAFLSLFLLWQQV